MNKQVGSVLLVLVGGAILRISAGDTYLRYVKTTLRPYLLVSGVVLVALGLLMLVDVLLESRRRGGAPTDADGDGGGDAHGHVHPASKASWLLVLPVLAIFLIAPPALGAFTAERATATVAAPSDGAPPLPPGNPVPVMLSDYAARAVWDNGTTLVGRTVSLVGFVTPGTNGSSWYLTRLSLTCCAADAVTTKILTVGPASTPATNTWVQVTGEWVPGGGTQSETAIPWVKVSAMTPIPQPQDPYE